MDSNIFLNIFGVSSDHSYVNYKCKKSFQIGSKLRVICTYQFKSVKKVKSYVKKNVFF